MSPGSNHELINLYPENLLSWGIDFDELGIDFSKNNVIIAFSREIKEMRFQRRSDFPYPLTPGVKTVMSKEFKANTVYVYKIPKYDVGENLIYRTNTFMEGEVPY
jgi:hypothetical protein